ncbi:hypothetical protein A2456_02390 [Candidatus Nomurabacteria bacterium RIFOXYC2_FULL_36_19]|uniref:Uncharacterized protein n=1 Tax=Candidatus Nomurabacteria bacterium RIFOXYC2_FULL_36_19 TaxID=1801806 RepID=A0A1F6YVQ2_9BACT|nr:MAG: hypothetical protein A2238_01435 [Candidatus Nomurabacteria bacterium RIFOXYA2_FULL_35_9]OGJ10479.1 MAG: hypothetical protein A2456_02390 [Candidatus Nomurabacteria bacterium RIFOXYC2_FULL_36_19]
MLLRITFGILLLISVLFLPIWISAILALIGMIYFSLFLEAVFLFLLSDLLFGLKENGPFGIIFFSFTITLICFVILELLKKKLRLHT